MTKLIVSIVLLQSHRATIISDNDKEKDVIMKVQYPGVANSIESDLSNLQMLVKVTGLAPPGLYIDEVIRVGRQELIAGKVYTTINCVFTIHICYSSNIILI